MSAFAETIETARLVLRKPQPDDAQAIFDAYAQDREVTRYLMWRTHTSIETTRAFVESSIEHWRSGTAFPYVITLKPGAEVIGMIEMRPEGHRANFGYVLAQGHWGRALGPEAIAAVTQIALAIPEIIRIYATCDVENVRSARALEKAGFEREGLLRRYIIHPNISAEPRDSFLYARVR